MFNCPDYKVHFVDCGGNIGQSVEYALDKYKNCLYKVDSFEPYHRNYELIEEKFKDNSLVEVHRNGVSTKTEQSSFYIQDWGARTGSSLELGKSSTQPDKFITIECVDIIKWLEDNLSADNYNVFKIDIEGTEYQVIDKLLDSDISLIINEWLIEWTPKAKLPNISSEYMEYVKKKFFDKKYKYIDWSFHVC
jgi:FkbM family methyltransferase